MINKILYKNFFLVQQFSIIFILVIAILVSALSIVYVIEKNRLLFIKLQQLQKQHDAMQVTWGQLLLEQSTWATQSRIEKIAEEKLNMVFPKQSNIMIVQE